MRKSSQTSQNDLEELCEIQAANGLADLVHGRAVGHDWEAASQKGEKFETIEEV